MCTSEYQKTLKMARQKMMIEVCPLPWTTGMSENMVDVTQKCGEEIRRRFGFVFVGMRYSDFGALWFIICPKLRIEAWEHIPICVWTFLEISKC